MIRNKNSISNSPLRENGSYLSTICTVTAFYLVLMKSRDSYHSDFISWDWTAGGKWCARDLPTLPRRSLSDGVWSPAFSSARVGPGDSSPPCCSWGRVALSGHLPAWQCKVLTEHSWPAGPWRHAQKPLSGKTSTRVRNTVGGISAQSHKTVNCRVFGT